MHSLFVIQTIQLLLFCFFFRGWAFWLFCATCRYCATCRCSVRRVQRTNQVISCIVNAHATKHHSCIPCCDHVPICTAQHTLPYLHAVGWTSSRSCLHRLLARVKSALRGHNEARMTIKGSLGHRRLTNDQSYVRGGGHVWSELLRLNGVTHAMSPLRICLRTVMTLA